jgi:hypothetical protein
MSSTALYYAVNDAPTYLYYAEQSLSSLRERNRRIPVHLFVYGSPTPAFRRRAAALGARLSCRRLPRVPDQPFVKWLPLGELGADAVAYVDADTLFFADPALLFRRYRQRGFYARREVGTAPGDGRFLIGSLPVFQGVAERELRALAARLAARPLPLFNSGVMIFNRGMHRRVAERVPAMLELGRGFASRRLAYPLHNRGILEEVAASLAMGQLARFDWGFLRREDAPLYIEWRANYVAGRGVVLHTLSQFFLHAVAEFRGHSALARSPDPKAPFVRVERRRSLPRRGAAARG